MAGEGEEACKLGALSCLALTPPHPHMEQEEQAEVIQMEEEKITVVVVVKSATTIRDFSATGEA